MQRIAKFYTVTSGEFVGNMQREFGDRYDGEELLKMYDKIWLPQRATRDSAGYDFRTPFGFTLKPGESIKVPTGIRVAISEGWFLAVLPRSGLGFKYRVQLDNTVGIIDGDYFHTDNEGHIMIKITNDSRQGKVLELDAGDRFAQGIFLMYGITDDDNAQEIRSGGFGSTGQ